MIKRHKASGPAVLIAAAFIGPGTLATCTMAGIHYSAELLWILLTAGLATIVLQEMALRLGTVARMGLGESIQRNISNVYIKSGIVALVLLAIVGGNAAYEAGNLSGAGLGVEILIYQVGLESPTQVYTIFVLGTLVSLFLLSGKYVLLQRVLMGTVVLMSLAFLISAALSVHSVTSWRPTWRLEAAPIMLSLFGTTIVPYNLFLYASLSKKHWTEGALDLKAARRDMYLALSVGMFISICIVITAAGNHSVDAEGLAALSAGLEAGMGTAGKWIIGLGLLSAGISSAITAPLAAALVCKEIFFWSESWKDVRFRSVLMLVLIMGVYFSAYSERPIWLIQTVQAVNGFMLPIIMTALLFMCAQKKILGNFANTLFQNFLGILLLIISLGLCLHTLWSIFV